MIAEHHDQRTGILSIQDDERHRVLARHKSIATIDRRNTKKGAFFDAIRKGECSSAIGAAHFAAERFTTITHC
ncbi:hypothetical protein [Mesorhizobium loti]|uniref:hypothetical protein n=1 Tax=Rhizobium loti TaxID=381 RepID=UPI000D6DBC60|nr:hypothetical protein [Mesorhizobium loti]QKC82230.1 hypothetical protein EB232_11850 [Mesorhizobium sp. NZP2077]